MNKEYSKIEIISYLFVIICILSFIAYKISYAVGAYYAIK